jgi:Ran GTPase-activating protein (RanGAP) involved in mRNA processing and transport
MGGVGGAATPGSASADDDAAKRVGRGARALGDLIRGNKSLLTLILSNNHFGPVTCREISQALVTNGTLTELDFSKQNDPRHPGVGIGKEGAASFAGVMATGGSKIALRVLDLSNNGLGPDGARAIEEALGGKRRRQTRLTAALDTAAPDKLEKAKQARSTSLKDLRLSYNRFGYSGAASLGRLLASNGSLTSIDVSYNSLGELNGTGRDGRGIAKLTAGLGKNKCLINLNLAGNGVSNRGAAVLSQALRTHPTMATIQLENNEIELVGAMELAKLATMNPRINVVNVAGNILRPQVEELRSIPRPGDFYSRVAPTREEAGAMWIHRDLETSVNMKLGHALKTSVEIPRNIIVRRNTIRVPPMELPQARRFDRPRKRFNV